MKAELSATQADRDMQRGNSVLLTVAAEGHGKAALHSCANVVKWTRAAGPLGSVSSWKSDRSVFLLRLLLRLWACGQRGSVIHHVHSLDAGGRLSPDRHRRAVGERLVRINRKRVQRLMRVMGIEALVPRPGTSKAAPGHKIYPYLLRGLKIVEPNHVWAADVTFIPMACGFLYLVVIIDWASRAVLAWRLSNTNDASFCAAALEEALLRFGTPRIFNTDSQRITASFRAA